MRTRAMAIVLLLGFVSMGLPSCQRHAEIRDELSAPFKPPPMIKADTREVDSGLGTSAFPECAQRPAGNCVGSPDIPCSFLPWASDVAKFCFRKTGCKANGTLDITMSAEGCVVALAMDQPDDDIVRCVVQEVGHVSCPCTLPLTASYFFGIGNKGCIQCSQEFPCPGRLTCEEGRCVDKQSDAGDAGN